MIDAKTAKPQKGLWDSLPTEDIEQAPKVNFDVNIPVTVVFNNSEAREYPDQSGDGVFYVFDVSVNGQNKAIVTSAWTLLRALKTLSPLQGKQVVITKKLVKGKQTFEVTEVK